jgi:hypothetical protein
MSSENAPIVELSCLTNGVERRGGAAPQTENQSLFHILSDSRPAGKKPGPLQALFRPKFRRWPRAAQP